MSSFDIDKANNLLQKYKSNNNTGYYELSDYLSVIKTTFKDNLELVKDNDFINFIYNIISCTEKDFEFAEQIKSSCVTITETVKQCGGSGDFYIQCLLKRANCDNHLDISLCEDILEKALVENIYLETISAMTNLIKNANKLDAFDLLYVCCKKIDSNKQMNIGGKSNYKIGAIFLKELQNIGYEIPLSIRLLKKTMFISKFESKCNKEIGKS